MAKPLSWGIFCDLSGFGSSKCDLKMIKWTELLACFYYSFITKFELNVVKGKLCFYLGALLCGESHNLQFTVC